MPLTATVTEINAALNDNPELVNSDPYHEGWMVKVTLSDESEISSLLSAEEYKALVGA